MDLDEMLATANPPTIERGLALLDGLDGSHSKPEERDVRSVVPHGGRSPESQP